MGIFKKLSRLFSSPDPAAQDILWIAVQCNRCGEVIRARVNLHNDLTEEYTEAGHTTYFCHKVLIGEGNTERLCFQRVTVDLTFDAHRRLTGKNASGGKFIEEEAG